MMHPECTKLLGELINLRLDSMDCRFVGGLELGAVLLTAPGYRNLRGGLQKKGYNGKKRTQRQRRQKNKTTLQVLKELLQEAAISLCLKMSRPRADQR